VKEPLWISVEEAIAGNKHLVAQFGGLDAGVRDVNLLHAALARPLNKWHYEAPQPSLYVLAAGYAYGIAKGHVFHDGNKRTAYLVAVTFLEMNGIICAPDQESLVETMVSVADGSMSEQKLAMWLSENSYKTRGLSEDANESFRLDSKKRTRGSGQGSKAANATADVRKSGTKPVKAQHRRRRSA